MKEVRAYKCDFCNKPFLRKWNAQRHEKSCYKNPMTRSCQTCIFLEYHYETVYNKNHGGFPGSTDYEKKVPWCYGEELVLFKTNCDRHMTEADTLNEGRYE